MEAEMFNQRTDLSELNTAVEQIRTTLGNIIVGQKDTIDFLIAALLADGHVLLEGVPGVAKTLSAKLIAKSIDASFSRIQFTPDLMPSDVLGTSVFDPRSATFEYRKGPVFGHIVLVDEINRAPAKTQSALFEVMEERQVTVDGHTYLMDEPFIVLATQNPIEQEGTYRLPEAQLDRFLFKIEVKYPSLEEETAILLNQHQRKLEDELAAVKAVLSIDRIKSCRALIKALHVEPKLIEYIAKITHETRNNKSLYLGASPRASLAMVNGAKAFAAMQGRDFVTPEDVIKVAAPVLAHRIMLTPDKEMEGLTTSDVVAQIIQKIEVPR
ncbi:MULTISPECIES: AAA family ATPase [Pedobacter]|uniref:ATPase associated with various cellular activities AAA_3 n=1 Tax=Pedobacter heparinus (strain ATCC 13125 / DSM 2366 / CIP 104194 / JCM 7457 / NBRC 12017 / NCIMB 9290 / NRRL B-14731 / HIM 762-3) TaxID=485917 RepID=C6XYY1_PEDHD|nr:MULTISPECIES: MoxR family ATPase [Pedobacter]ACU02463.1 ATPase associated with various cellular activities AAA_3 [Pedobacter heparinus DSM 2366]MBB5440149.1 MoxR-like ATPase [Pedobacter sp. AK017]